MFRPWKSVLASREMLAEHCSVCKVFVADWLGQAPLKDSEFYSSIRRKGIDRRLPEIADAIYRIIRSFILLTPETIVKSSDYNAEALLDFYKSGTDIMSHKEIPEEERPLVLMFYRNEFIKCIFKQTCNTDLEYIFAILSDENCSKDSFIISQWVADSLFNLRPLEMIHNDHKHSIKF